MNTKRNQHYQTTHQQIQQALMTLLEKNELGKISVRQICELVGINRSTFYTHYSSVYDLWADLDSVLRVGQMQYFEEAGIQLTDFLSAEGLTAILHYMSNYRSFYCSYIGLLGSPEYIRSAFEELWEANLENPFWVQCTDKEHMRRAFSYFMGGSLKLIQLWLDDDCQASINDIAATLYSFIPQELAMSSNKPNV